MKFFSLTALLLLFCLSVSAQQFTRMDAPVIANDTPLLNPWAGGLNAPQWNKVDLDNDGILDLYAFDRVGSIHLAFRNNGTPNIPDYQFAPQLVAYFPEGLNFAVLRDYNTDGASDLFMHAGDIGIAGLKVFKGRFENNRLHFTQVLTPQWIFDVLVFDTGGGNYTNVLVNLTDHPAIDDLDGDGDLDILAIGISGSYISYYENVAIEMGYTDDTLIFQHKDQCWGKVYIAPFSEEFTLSGNASQCALFTGEDPIDYRGGLHGGGTLCTFDANGDGTKDVLYGDLIFAKLTFGQNGGSSENAWITNQDVNFPSYDVAVDIPHFPAAYLLDYDNDGVKDLLVSPNDTRKTPDREVLWFYRNTQSNSNPHFVLQQKDALVKTMLDFGSGAQPAVADINGDGLLDIVVGNYNYFTPDEPVVLPDLPGLYLLLNTGTASEPAFELVDSDWLGFSAFGEEAYAFAPTFGDLDDDGDLDLLIGERFGSLFYLENTAGAGNPMTFAPLQSNWQNINVGQYATPCIYDLNGDGAPDLIIGERNGNINYLPNLGTAGNPAYHPNPDEAPNNRFLGKISTQQFGFPTGYSAPVVLAFDEATYLLTGSETGWIQAYIVEKDSLNGGSFPVLSKTFGNLRDGQETRLAFADLNGDNYLDLIKGNRRGGLGLWGSPFHTTGGLTAANETLPAMELVVWPNPSANTLYIRLPEISSGTVQLNLFDLQGRLLHSRDVQYSGVLSMDVSSQASGMYLLQVIAGGRIAARRIVVYGK